MKEWLSQNAMKIKQIGLDAPYGPTYVRDFTPECFCFLLRGCKFHVSGKAPRRLVRSQVELYSRLHGPDKEIHDQQDRERVIFGAEPMTTINIFGHCSEDGSNLVERLLWEWSWDGRRKRIEKKPWTGLRPANRKPCLCYAWAYPY